MELLLNKNNKDILSVYTNVSGEIIYSSSDMDFIKINNTDKGIFEIVDKNKILKLSLHDGCTEHLESNLEGYRNCIATVAGKGIGKHIRLCFVSDDIYNSIPDNGKDLNKMLKRHNEFITTIKSVNIDLLILKIVKALQKEGISIKKGESINIECPLNLNTVEIMAVCSASILCDISPKGTIIANADITDYGMRINMYTDTEKTETVRGVVDFCQLFPNSSANILHLNSIASREGMELDLFIENRICSVSFTYPLGEITEFDVLASDMYDEEKTIKRIIDAFFTFN